MDMAPGTKLKRQAEPWKSSKQKSIPSTNCSQPGDTPVQGVHVGDVEDSGTAEKIGNARKTAMANRKKSAKKPPGPDAARALEEEFFTLNPSKTASAYQRHQISNVGSGDTAGVEEASKFHGNYHFVKYKSNFISDEVILNGIPPS